MPPALYMQPSDTPTTSPALMPGFTHQRSASAGVAPRPSRRQVVQARMHPMKSTSNSPHQRIGSGMMQSQAINVGKPEQGMLLPPPAAPDDLVGHAELNEQLMSLVNALRAPQQAQDNVSPITPLMLLMSGTPADMPEPPQQRSSAPSSLPSSNMVSPAIRPLLPTTTNPDVTATLTHSSNYSLLKHGTHESLGLTYGKDASTGLDKRKTNHKYAEQKRRDGLKRGFEDLRAILLELPARPDEPVAIDLMSKVQLIERGCEEFRALQAQLRQTQVELENLRQIMYKNSQ